MGAPERLIKKIENNRKERRQSRKQSRAQLMNSKRNLIIEETKEVQPELSEAEKLKLWRIEKKKKMEEEKLRRRPPFITYINVKHTGLTPFKKPTTLMSNKHKANKFVFQLGPINAVNSNTNKHTENFKQAVPAKTTKQTKSVPLNPENTLKKLENMRITRQKANKANAELVHEVVQRKALRIVQSSSKQVRVTRSTKKTENDAKPLIKPTVHKKEAKEPKGNSAQTKIDKENVPAEKENKLLANSNCKGCREVKQPLTRSRKGIKNEANSEPVVEPPNGPTFQRTRLEEETKKLQDLKELWLSYNTENIPKEIYEEILTITGQTSLLISSKFEQFRSLINECATQLANNLNDQLKVTADDLDGFWEMMFLQVVQLHNKYMKLEKLMMNNWEEPDQKRKSKDKKPIIKTPLPKKRGKSRFKQFLAKQKTKNENISTGNFEERLVPDNGQFNEGPCNEVDLDLLKNCRVTPKAVKNLITARKSRRSSMNLIMSMSGVGKFDISGTALCASPKPEKTVTFTDSN